MIDATKLFVTIRNWFGKQDVPCVSVVVPLHLPQTLVLRHSIRLTEGKRAGPEVKMEHTCPPSLQPKLSESTASCRFSTTLLFKIIKYNCRLVLIR